MFGNGTCDGSASHLVFKGDNYEQWRKRIELRLDAKNLGYTLKLVEEGTKLSNKNKADRHDDEKIALNIIVSLIHDDVLRILGDYKTPVDIIAELDDIYQPANVNAAIAVRMRMNSMKLESCKDTRTFINEMLKCFNDLKVLKEPVSETEKLTAILTGIPSSYGNVSAVATAMAELSSLTVGTLRNMLLNEKVRRNMAQPRTTKPAALTTSSSASNPPSSDSNTSSNTNSFDKKKRSSGIKRFRC